MKTLLIIATLLAPLPATAGWCVEACGLVGCQPEQLPASRCTKEAWPSRAVITCKDRGLGERVQTRSHGA